MDMDNGAFLDDDCRGATPCACCCRCGHLLLLLVVFLLFSTFTTFHVAARSEVTLRIISAERCQNVPGMAMTQGNTSLRMEGKTRVVFDIDMYVNKTATTLTKLVVNRKRCRDYISRETCNQDENYTFPTGVCSLLGAPMMPWSNLVESVRPALKCPLKKGSYSGRGIGLDLKALKTLLRRRNEDLGSIFAGSGTIFDQDELPFMCIAVAADLVRVKTQS